MRTALSFLKSSFAALVLVCVAAGCSTTQSASDVNWQSGGFNGNFDDDKIRSSLPSRDFQSAPEGSSLNDWVFARDNCYTLSLLSKQGLIPVPKSALSPASTKP